MDGREGGGVRGWAHLAALPLPEDRGLGVPPGLTGEGGGVALSHDLVPGPDHELGRLCGHMSERRETVTAAAHTLSHTQTHSGNGLGGCEQSEDSYRLPSYRTHATGDLLDCSLRSHYSAHKPFIQLATNLNE